MAAYDATVSGEQGGGFTVQPPRLRQAGETAQMIGDQVAHLSEDVGPASTVPNGLAVGDRLKAAAPLWEKHLKSVGADVHHTGETLCTIADNYTANDTRSADAIRSIRA
jgi:hypothetical protein